MDRHATPPFMLQLFCRAGAFHRPDEFTSTQLPPHLSLYTWPNCTLTELAHQITSSSDDNTSLLPPSAIGTRLAFRLIFPDTRSNANGAMTARYMVKELGSVIIGDGGRGLDPDDLDAERSLETETDGSKTLSEARFVVGDYISCAILPPLPDGSVAPPSSARMGRGAGASEPRAAVGRTPSGPGRAIDRERERERERENGFGRPGRGRERGRGGFDDFVGGRAGRVPMGEWRRGERLPDAPSPARPRGRGGRF
ncbi:Uu.00g080300.m01.CDS01 [Anthostomella pinea]|uniref:Uu.00g080300.m01.CDS01 n=1 Tax=Anthostomella pinea TaxID=933095 RepID=A0AAI8VL00_9PEZI|nr:Uu.00g080300.m01.CDS01 [Anthostomella pinea]